MISHRTWANLEINTYLLFFVGIGSCIDVVVDIFVYLHFFYQIDFDLLFNPVKTEWNISITCIQYLLAPFQYSWRKWWYIGHFCLGHLGL